MWQGFAGSALGAAAGLGGALYQNAASKAAADKQMRFQRKVLQKQMQWRAEDFRKAGYNEILGFQSSAIGAPGASYAAQNPGLAAAEGGELGVSSAKSAAFAKQEMRNLRAAEVKLREEGHAAKAAGWNQHFQSELAKQRVLTGAATAQGNLDASSAKAMLDIIKNAAGKKAYQGGLLRKWLLSGADLSGALRK